MTYNSKSNGKINNIDVSQNQSINASDFVTRANDTSMVILNGFIESLYVVNDSIFATIRKDVDSSFSPTHDQIDHGDGWFNGPDRTPVQDTTVEELAILTNIDASNNELGRYIGKSCRVTVKNGIAVYAEVSLGFPSLTTITSTTIRKARIALGSKTTDIFSEIGKKYFKEQGYTEEEVDALSQFKYTDEMVNKINTFEGEAVWFKDTGKQQKEENIIKPNAIMLGLNKLGMKTKDCHKPSNIFSGK